MPRFLVLLVVWATAIPAGATVPRFYRFTAHPDFNADELRETQAAVKQILELLPHWSWAKTVKNRWEFRFGLNRNLRGVVPGTETAPGLNDDGESLLFLIWDVLKSKSEFPRINSFEHIAAHLYRVTNMGPDPLADEALAIRLQNEGVYLALADIQKSPAYPKLTGAERAKIDADLAEYLEETRHGLTSEQLAHLNCASRLRGNLQ